MSVAVGGEQAALADGADGVARDTEAGAGLGHPFDVELRTSGLVLHVPSDRTLLDVICDALPDTPFGCRQGYCGACETAVVTGRVDHRDDLFTEEERAQGKSMLICVSRALDDRIVLDL